MDHLINKLARLLDLSRIDPMSHQSRSRPFNIFFTQHGKCHGSHPGIESFQHCVIVFDPLCPGYCSLACRPAFSGENLAVLLDNGLEDTPRVLKGISLIVAMICLLQSELQNTRATAAGYRRE